MNKNYPREPGSKKPLGFAIEPNHALTLRSENHSTSIEVGAYPNGSDLYIKTENNTLISVDPDGRVRIDIPPLGV